MNNSKQARIRLVVFKEASRDSVGSKVFRINLDKVVAERHLETFLKNLKSSLVALDKEVKNEDNNNNKNFSVAKTL